MFKANQLMEKQLDVNNFMLDLERCKNKQEMRTVFEKYYPNKRARAYVVIDGKVP